MTTCPNFVSICNPAIEDSGLVALVALVASATLPADERTSIITRRIICQYLMKRECKKWELKKGFSNRRYHFFRFPYLNAETNKRCSVTLKPQTIATERARSQAKINDPIFAFVLDLAYGKNNTFPTYKVDRPIAFEYDVKATDFPITDNLFQNFKKFAIEKYNFTAAQIDKEREFVERNLRSELVTAAYGSTTSFQVFNEYDTQLKKAIELLPEAKQLALEGAKANAKKENSGLNR